MAHNLRLVGVLAVLLSTVQAQEQAAPICYGPGSLATAIVLTFLFTLLLVGGVLYFLKRRADAKKDNHLILETDPERGGKAEYAFDNPGFKDATLISTTELFPKSETKPKKAHWSPFAGLTLKPDKKRALDDSALQSNEVKVVELKSQDFTGLGFTICGNMKEGIYIRDILHRGPAFESGKLNPGDRINSVTISFEHMVYEDALNILSYASPYEVIIEAKGSRMIAFTQGQGQTPVHPIYRSSSLVDLLYPEKSAKKKLYPDDYSSGSNYSSLQKSRSNVTTLERKESKSPRPNQSKPKKLTPETLNSHLAQSIAEETRKSNGQLQQAQKFGVKVLPIDTPQKSPKIFEQNQNNVNIERNLQEEVQGIDEVDVKPQAKKREKKSPDPGFHRNDSGIRRDPNGIPLEIPDHMNDAALMARRNRKSAAVDSDDAPRKSKGKAPSPPPGELKANFSLGGGKTRAFEDLSALDGNDSSPMAPYGSDSEDDQQNMSSVNTIELNASDITIHQTEDEAHTSRKTASTGDLTKMKKSPRSNNGTLERAQSLDITDTSGSNLSKKRTYDARENLLIDREPRLSLILDGLTSFQRDRLKTSTEWGNLEDAILSLNRDEEGRGQRRTSEPQFNAVMDRVIQIKRESQEIDILPDEVIRQYQRSALPADPPAEVVNKLWPDEQDMVQFEKSGWKRLEKKPEITKRSLEIDEEPYNKRQPVPVVPERTKLKISDQPGEKKMDVVRGPTSPAKLASSSLICANPPLTLEYECIKPVPPKREKTPDKETVINLNSKIGKVPPVTSFEKQNISEMCSQIAKGRNGENQMIKDEWEVDALQNISPPASMTLVDEVMDSYNKNYGSLVTVVDSEPASNDVNLPDETKSVCTVKNLTANFLLNERTIHDANTNIPDDLKVSRGSFESLEAKRADDQPKSDDAKSEDLLVSHVTVTDNGASNLHSLELSINNEPSDLYSTALEDSLGLSTSNDVTVIVSRPNKITVKKIETGPKEPLVEITESSFSKVTKGPDEVPVNVYESKQMKIEDGAHQDDYKVEITESKYSTFEVDKPQLQAMAKSLHMEEPLVDRPPKEAAALQPLLSEPTQEEDQQSFITEIQVLTPNNVSEVKIGPDSDDHLENAFENYVKSFESKLGNFESNMQSFEDNLEDFIREEPKSMILDERADVERQVSKIQELAEEQLKTLPEMRFSTSSYESGGRKTPEKRHSFELLRSNFEKTSNDKSPQRRDSTTPPKSRIPISTTMKTPPMSPERRDSRNLDNENERALLELMSSSSIHSTPFQSKIKPPTTKNVSVTSIKNNSKAPSGLPTLSSRPPIPPRKSEDNGNGGVESSFKQWVFNPSNVTNVTVGKDK
ncbi:uncharacterized protein LOC125505585 [Dendroctonus ponderosae]|uniref:uncharacterized protein LOC125505585 n=1 Tax=Dendroctonus ponderosae TaxID=77166 RepID=UPI00203635EF|nr:uncharacterized protein LOC125505585 [Dendroctonus ponderosae]KAH1008596.1 hypothetical protein HUJ05_009140 [Dendroctonus ponderosae]